MDISIGRRVQTLRLLRSLTQQQLADELGLSLIWVKKFEGGDVQADPRLSLLERLAKVLAVPLAALLDEDAAMEDAPVDGVRDALLAPMPLQDPGSVDIHRQTRYGYAAFQAGRWRDVVDLLPRLLGAARAAEGDRGEPQGLLALADVCHLAAITLTKLGDAPGGWAAGSEAVRRAEAAGHPVDVALAAQSAVYAMTAAGRPDIGLAMAHRIIDDVGAQLAALGPDGVSALGMLHLKAAYAAATAADADLAMPMIREGHRLAALLAPDADHRDCGFNATNALIYEASILGDLGQHEQALVAAARIDGQALAALTRERRVHHLVDTARSAHGAGRPDDALRLLQAAERDDPQNVRTWSLSRSVIVNLLTCAPQPSDGRGLRALATRAGVAQ